MISANARERRESMDVDISELPDSVIVDEFWRRKYAIVDAIEKGEREVHDLSRGLAALMDADGKNAIILRKEGKVYYFVRDRDCEHGLFSYEDDQPTDKREVR